MGKLPHKIPDDINLIFNDIKKLGEKKLLCQKYDCSRSALDEFLFRRGYKLEAQTSWVLRPLSDGEKKK